MSTYVVQRAEQTIKAFFRLFNHHGKYRFDSSTARKDPRASIRLPVTDMNNNIFLHT
jgi:hypothetical protein